MLRTVKEIKETHFRSFSILATENVDINSKETL